MIVNSMLFSMENGSKVVAFCNLTLKRRRYWNVTQATLHRSSFISETWTLERVASSFWKLCVSSEKTEIIHATLENLQFLSISHNLSILLVVFNSYLEKWWLTTGYLQFLDNWSSSASEPRGSAGVGSFLRPRRFIALGDWLSTKRNHSIWLYSVILVSLQCFTWLSDL